MTERSAESVPAALSDAEIHHCTAETVLHVLLPAIPDDAEWARAAAIQLVGLTRYAARRGPDRTEARAAEVAETLDALAANELVAAAWQTGSPPSLAADAAGAILAAAVVRSDGPAEEIRSTLRPLLLGHLEDELFETAPLVGAFRGKLDD